MKTRILGALALGVAALWLAGCASSKSSLALETVGPASPGRGLATAGQLIVFTATAAHNDGNILYSSHTGYVLADATGKKLKYVPNRVGENDPTPMLLTLPAGQYMVDAQSEAYGRVRVPVRIEGGRLTRVYLERNGMPKGEAARVTGVVSFPNGSVIGPAYPLAKKD